MLYGLLILMAPISVLLTQMGPLGDLASHGVLGLVAAGFAYLFLRERKITADLTDRLIKLSTNSVQSSVAMTEVLRRVERTLDYVSRQQGQSKDGG